MEKIPLSDYFYYADKNGLIYNKHGKVLKYRITKTGYAGVLLYNTIKPKHFLVHRLIALTFIPNPNNYKTVNHINGVKTDCTVSNLEWCTLSQNHKHAFKNDLRNQHGERHPSNKLSKKQVLEIRALKGTMSQQKIADIYHITQVQVSNIQRNKSWVT